MRTTLDIDEDVLAAVKEIARVRGATIGKALSDLARKALEPTSATRLRNGVPLLPRRPGAPPVTMEWVNEFRDDE